MRQISHLIPVIAVLFIAYARSPGFFEPPFDPITVLLYGTICGMLAGAYTGIIGTLWGLGLASKLWKPVWRIALGIAALGVAGSVVALATHQPVSTALAVLYIPLLPVIVLARVPGRVLQKYPRESASAASSVGQHGDQFLQLDRAGVEVGAALIPVVQNPESGQSLLDRIGTLRRDMARRFGMWVPLVRVRDNSGLPVDAYELLVNGATVACGEIRINRLLAIRPDGVPIPVEGEDFMEPAFGLPARWISAADRAEAEAAHCVVVDAPSVLITHLREVLRRHAGDLLSLDDFAGLVEKLRETSPNLVADLVPSTLRLGTVHQIVTRLLEELVPITNLTLIFEVLSQNIGTTTDPDALVECVRQPLGRAICEPFTDDSGHIHGLVFEPALEHELRQARSDDHIDLPPEILERLILEIAEELRAASARKQEVCLLVDSSLRRPIRHMLRRGLPDLAVIAFSEIPIDTQVEAVATLKRGNGSVATTE